MKSNVIGLFLTTVAIVIVVISIITSISFIERETGLYDKIFYSYNVEPYNKQFIPIISNISNQSQQLGAFKNSDIILYQIGWFNFCWRIQ